ncbi:hypothetical protein DFH28DRAFT_1216389 [Melampsora americana]|nr:hypothetical protein DFH28DRAFT_1216389 [Melampsora americana]
MISITQPSSPSIPSSSSPPPHYTELSHSNSNVNSFNPYFPPFTPRPSSLIRRFTSPDLSSNTIYLSSPKKSHHPFSSFFSRVSSALKSSTLPNHLTSNQPKKLQKPPPKNLYSSSNKNKNLNYQPIILQPWLTDSDSEFDDGDDDDDDHNNDDVNVKVESRAPIRTIVKRTPVHFFTGDSTIIEIQTFWSDGTQIISKPQLKSHSILRKPEDWIGWPSHQI